jgi:tetratricopeptide (TPR) repeat protein
MHRFRNHKQENIHLGGNMKTITTIAAALALSLSGAATAVAAGSVDTRLSTRETYVGIPVTLQITISNASDYEQPTIPDIDGCDSRAAGSPTQSSHVTIINGRRNERRSVTMQYLITPRRAGTFQIPSLAFNVDGRQVTTEPMRFVATKSVTGDLLFVEIAGSKDKVFVGQPIELTLKIWIKPYRDAERNITLSEESMWRMISRQTSWGGFAKRLEELANNNQRPGGREVLRDDGEGNQRSYYLYEIDATVYPKRPGKIDADDVQIVVNYPTAIGRSRSPFGSLFDDDDFFGGSPLSRMMNDDFFASPLSNRLAVTATRPIVGEVSVDETQVVPVPSEGRPADYRGAVGRYRIITQANPTTVAAGDPITLNIGITGDGPMELVQAPPLAQLSAITSDFRVEDQSLAGFVQDDAKLFSTSIRPRRAGITQIPAIPLSFFDPETEQFETVMSDPIAITVTEAETLALDAIVGTAANDRSASGSPAAQANQPDFTNSDSSSLLVSQTPRTAWQWWWGIVVIPPVLWLATLVTRYRAAITSRLSSFRSAYRRCEQSIQRASDRPAIAAALIRYIAARSGQDCQTGSRAVGALRVSGIYAIANQVEAFLQESEQLDFADVAAGDLTPHRQHAHELLDKVQESFQRAKGSRVRPEQPRQSYSLSAGGAQRSLALLIAATFAFAASDSSATEVDPISSADVSASQLSLTTSQQELLLPEAHERYGRARELSAEDSAEAKELFQAAAGKYQLLADSGIRNSDLYLNLGNAYLQSGELGRAIANYELARQLDPGNRQLLANLEFANAKVLPAGSAASDVTAPLTAVGSMMSAVSSFNNSLIQLVGLSTVIGVLVITSVVFWGLLIVRTAGYRFPLWRFAALPLLGLLVSLGSYTLAASDMADSGNGVVVVDSLLLHAGDGAQFAEVAKLEAAQGHRVEVLTTRGDWTQLRTAQGHVGWVPAKEVLRIRS